MVFFPVDDDFPFSKKAIAAGNAAVGLWARAGAYCMKEATGGVLTRDEVLPTMGTPGQVKKLVEVRLWHSYGHECERCPQPPKGGWVFHDWEDVGPIKTTEQIKARREADRVRQANWRERQRDVVSHGVTDHVTADVTNNVSDGVTNDAPSPSPSLVTSVSQSPSLTRVIRLTDEDIEKIKKRLTCDRRHALRVADQVLDKAAATVARPGRYVLAAIEAEPALYRPARRNTKDDQCPVHPGNPKPPFCGGCNTDARTAK